MTNQAHDPVEALVEFVRSLRSEMELRFSGRLAENAINTLDAVQTALQQSSEREAKLTAENRRLNQALGDKTYMLEAYRQMLGEKGRQVAKLWEEQGLLRTHSSWAIDPYALPGEEVAEIHLAWEAAPQTRVDSLDGHLERQALGGSDEA